MLRLNAKTESPNPHFNFITALPSFTHAPSLPSQQQAKQLLDALAAQVRPICKKHGFVVNSFEEYEYNKVFLGRNWNAGETIEIVLRRSDGAFHGVHQLIQVVCHELAHIKNMNHGPGFQELNAQLCHEVMLLRSKNYYGDGLYSSGSRLSDSAEVAGQGLRADGFDLPEYMCGGAQQRQRASTLRRRPRSGTNTNTKRRKAGSRVTSKFVFGESGQALNSHITDESEKKKGIGFRKRAQSAKERQARLEATEKRLKGIAQSSTSSEQIQGTHAADKNSDLDSDGFEETDESRLKLLSDAGQGWRFDLTPSINQTSARSDSEILDLVSDDESHRAAGPNSKEKKVKLDDHSPKVEKRTLILSNIARSEIEHRTRQSLGLVGGRKLGSTNGVATKSRLLGLSSTKSDESVDRQVDYSRRTGASTNNPGVLGEWACAICTCVNHDDYGICQVCTTRRGSKSQQT